MEAEVRSEDRLVDDSPSLLEEVAFPGSHYSMG